MSEEQKAEQAAPGWYPVPNGGGVLRYWDGRQWVGDVVPPPIHHPHAQGRVGSMSHLRLVIAIAGGIMLAVLILGGGDLFSSSGY